MYFMSTLIFVQDVYYGVSFALNIFTLRSYLLLYVTQVGQYLTYFTVCLYFRGRKFLVRCHSVVTQ